MNGYTILRGMQHYVGKIRTMRNEIRTQRFMNALPADIRKDIGWPDMYARASPSRQLRQNFQAGGWRLIRQHPDIRSGARGMERAHARQQDNRLSFHRGFRRLGIWASGGLGG
ncbi:hypothetical protein [Mesorhizobium sp. B2-3-12]|uniref:hypothetical protein n=1 Tax=Mesorhizobium sp. B2-3-12 TaxID=2589952 RepID=UPI0015E2F2EF|nr:hypothetical protein [Mesorhizobium sp. B2-3-12]